MKLRMKLRSKLLLSVLLVATVVFLVSISYLTTKLETITLRNAFKYVDATTAEYSNKIKAGLDSEIGMARSMAQSFTNFEDLSKDELRSSIVRMIKGVTLQNPDFLSTWVSWQLKYYDESWDKPYGRQRYTYYWENGKMRFVDEKLNLDGENPASVYYQIKQNKKEVAVDPYWYSYTGSDKRILETSLCVPLVKNDQFVALFGFDVELARYQNFIKDIKPYTGSFAILLSQDGTVVSHTDSSYIGTKIDSLFSKETVGVSIMDTIAKGKAFSFNLPIEGKDYWASFSPFQIGTSDNHWYLAIISPKDVIIQEAKDVAKRSRGVIIAGLVILAIIIWLISFSITRPLVRARKVLGDLAKGKIDTKNKINIKTGDEVEDIATSINILIDSLSKTANFAREIGAGNLNVQYNKLSDKDILGEALLDMRKSLEYAKKIDENRKQEEEKNRWANEGIAKFAEILRNNNENLQDFTYEVIHNLVKYVGCNMGAIFLVNNDNPKDIFYEMMASYAYERRKFEEKRIDYGEGLVGRCAKESETIYLTEIPADYIKIASGLGEESPTSLLLVPMKLNDEVYGVIEMASFEDIENYKIKFIEKIGESIAATISNVKINVRTAKLLEESRIKSEELASQEEELRQNMEELQTTQEESARKKAEMESLINALHSSSYVIEYDRNGNITSVNQAYLSLTGQPEKEVLGTHHTDNLEMTEEQKMNYQKFWNDLLNGVIKKETNKVNIGGKSYTFIETYSPIYNENHQVVKILKIAHNITDFVQDETTKKKSKK